MVAFVYMYKSEADTIFLSLFNTVNVLTEIENNWTLQLTVC